MKKKNNFSRAFLPSVIVISALVLSSCASRNLVYFSDLPRTSSNEMPIKNYVQPTIQPDDILGITVSSLNPESNVLFNNVILPTTANSAGVIAATKVTEGYLVDKTGFINFPVIGKVMLAGLSKEQATEKMTSEIKQHVKNPIVNITTRYPTALQSNFGTIVAYCSNTTRMGEENGNTLICSNLKFTSTIIEMIHSATPIPMDAMKLLKRIPIQNCSALIPSTAT